ncbi:MAG: hypothetical protein KJ950_06550 [Proteobacteria bacterium]|nr:hypothetical protein [Pseudomonadota bacterium]MBU1687193.1 hypothetical protein [Pseudomonadota bacterium]
MLQSAEIINLSLAMAAIILMQHEGLLKALPNPRLFLFALLLIIASYCFTVLEGVLWGDFFNLLEHLCYFLAGLFFITAVTLDDRPLPKDTQGGRI